MIFLYAFGLVVCFVWGWHASRRSMKREWTTPSIAQEQAVLADLYRKIADARATLSELSFK